MNRLKTLTVNGKTYEVASVKPAASVTLRANSWSGSGTSYSQVVAISDVTSSTKVDLQPTATQLAEFHHAVLALVAENDGGTVTVYAIGDKPTKDYTIQITKTEVTGVGKIRGNTVGTSMPRTDFNQTDSSKADYLVGREKIVQTVNGTEPDENGNVEITIPDSPQIENQVQVFYMSQSVDYPVSGFVTLSVPKNLLSNGGLGIKTDDILISTNGTVCKVTTVYSNAVNCNPIGTIGGNSEDQIIATLEAYLAENPISGETQYLHIKYSDNGERFTGTLDNLVTDLSRWESGYYGKNKVECAYAICLPEFIDNSNAFTAYRHSFVREGYTLRVTNYSTDELSSFMHHIAYTGNSNRDSTHTGKFLRLSIEATDTSATYETIIADIEANGFPVVFGPLRDYGEVPGAYVGLLLDSNEEDSLAFRLYTWIKLGGGDVDLSGYAQKSEIPTKVSQLENDRGYLTEHQSLAEYAKTSDIPTKPEDIGAQPSGNYLTEIPSGYATEEFVKNKIAEAELGGEDVDLSGYAQKSELPTKVSQLENDSGYLTEHQDISGKLDASELTMAINTALAQAKASGEFDGKPGEKGDPGKTPEKGTDYFTDADKNEMVNAVLSALPTWTGGSY